MNRISLFYFLVFCFVLGCKKERPDAPAIQWIESKQDNFWQQKTILLKDIGTNSISSPNSISISTDETHQEIDGFGGCFNELGYKALQTLSLKDQDTILQAIFHPETGCKFSVCRMPIGANDYAMDWYSHNEKEGDFEMKNFSIKRDQQVLIPYIKKALKINPDISIWASPWCPPSWMKTNKHYACKPDVVNDLSPLGKGEELRTQFIMQQPYLSAYALYFSKFIQRYEKEGIPIDAIHVQNEPNSCQNFPSCIWAPNDLATFIGDYLGPQFSKDTIATDIWLGTIERPQIERIDSILQKPSAKKYIKGVGFQWAGKGAIPIVHQKYKQLRLMQTETECGNGSNDWKALEHTYGLLQHYLHNGANSYLYWNLILDESGKSQWGWKQNSMISIDSSTKEVRYNPEFYLMKHFSYFIEKGAFKINTSDRNCLAFKNKKSITLIYYNSGEETSKSFRIDKNLGFTISLAAKSLHTFKIPLQLL